MLVAKRDIEYGACPGRVEPSIVASGYVKHCFLITKSDLLVAVAGEKVGIHAC